ncbi:MAG: Gfo/Idh/MocA family oxidoreductase, partial [Chitinophagaceae bacterium]|nr:Gfo/Idh/MocA family oxidoreductase [Chitinophagaceae bacterium]
MKAVAESGLAEIVAIFDPSEGSMIEASKIAVDCKTPSSFIAMISDPDIDGIVIATPSALHKEQVIQAFESNKAVFCQKPLGTNAKEVKVIIDAAEKANKLLG